MEISTSDAVISKRMSETEFTSASQGAARLRRAERRQMAMVVQCPDDLVGPAHPVRLVMAVVEKLEPLEQAMAQTPAPKRKQTEAERRAGAGKQGEKVRQR